MALDDYLRFAQAIPDPILLVHPTGEVIGSNSAARSLFGDSARNVHDLAGDGEFDDLLRLASRSRNPISAAATLRTSNGDSACYRCDGALLRPRQGDDAPVLSLRFRSREASNTQFVDLNQKIKAFDGEIRTRRRVESLIRAQVETLEMMITGVPLPEVLERLIRTLERDAARTIFGSILLYDAGTGRLRHGAAPNLPQPYLEAIDGIQAGEGVGSCGTAAWRGRPVVVSDIETDPLWRDFRGVALAHGLRSCWSTPIISLGGEVIGTFAVYGAEPGRPHERELGTVALLTRTAAIAIERDAAETQRVELYRRERLAHAEAEKANRAKDDFLATVSHELRTPLTATLGWARLLRDIVPDDPKVAEAVEAIDASARAQAQIVDDLLDFSRIAADKLRVERRPVDLARAVTEAIATVRPSAELAGVTIEVERAPLEGVLLGDPDRLRQVVWNLLTNAIKFAPGRHVRVTVGGDRHAAVISVVDDGEGIPPEFLPRVFDRFSQADTGMRRKHGGLGLGLSIVRRLVELHGGTISVRSGGPGKGAEFVVRIPYTPVEMATEDAATQRRTAERILPAPAPSAETEGR